MSVLLPNSTELLPFVPEIVLTATMAVVLLIPVFSPKRNGVAVAVFAAAGLLVALAALVRFDPAANAGTFFGGLLLVDPFGWFLKIILLVFTLIVIALWALATRDSFAPGDAPEFFTLLLGATIGMMLMLSSTNLLMIFVAIEMTSLPSYVLAGFRKTHKLGAEAALKYVLFGAVSAAVMLYGMSLLYGFYGTLDLVKIAELGRNPAHPYAFGAPNAALVLGFPIMAILLGVAFKIAAVPMHFWCPDVFEGTHIDITTFLSVASKGAGLGLLVRIVLTLMVGGERMELPWLAVVIVAMGSVTCFWGNLGALRQNNIKRMLAFSSIAHAGYMMLALAATTASDGGTVGARPAEVVLFYMFGYLFMNAGAFAAAAAIGQVIKRHDPSVDGEDIRNFAGLSKRSPLLAVCMAVFVFSLTGIPLTVGFAVKLKLFQVLFEVGNTLSFVAIVVLGVNTVIAAFYYFRILKAMYLTTTPVEEAPEDAAPAFAWAPAAVLAAAMVVPNVGLFVAYNWVDDQSRSFSRVLMPAPSMAGVKAASPAAEVAQAH